MVLYYSHDVHVSTFDYFLIILFQFWISQIEVYSKENNFISHNLLFYELGRVIDPKMHNLQEIIRFFPKIQLYLNLYALIMTVQYHNTHQNL